MGPYICHVIIRFSLNKLKPLDQIEAITALFVKYHLSSEHGNLLLI